MKKDGKTLNAVTQKRLKDFNWADYRMYNYFKTKLDAESKYIKHFISLYISFVRSHKNRSS